MSDLFRNPPTDSVENSNSESLEICQSSQCRKCPSLAKSLIMEIESLPLIEPDILSPVHPASPDIRITKLDSPSDSISNSPEQIWPEHRKSNSIVSFSRTIFLHVDEIECMNARAISELSLILESSP